MIDIIVKALIQTLSVEFKDYFDMETVFSSSLDIETEFQRTQELKSEKMMKFMGSNVDGRVILTYNRTPLKAADNGRGTPVKFWGISAENHKKAQIREAIFGAFTVNFKLLSNIRDALEVFEMLYVMHRKLFTNLVISIKMEDVEKPEIFKYNVTGSDITTFDLVNFQKYGSVWELDFEMDVSGWVLSPESFYYPRLLNPKLNIFTTNRDKKVYSLDSNYILTIDEKYILDSEGNVVRNDQSVIKDSTVISSRFNID